MVWWANFLLVINIFSFFPLTSKQSRYYNALFADEAEGLDWALSQELAEARRIPVQLLENRIFLTADVGPAVERLQQTSDTCMVTGNTGGLVYIRRANLSVSRQVLGPGGPGISVTWHLTSHADAQAPPRPAEPGQLRGGAQLI